MGVSVVAITSLNGRLPTSALSPISLGFSLRRDAAASYLRARTAGAPAGITTAYRTLAEQDALYKRLGYPTALPAGQSQHGEGVAIDVPEPARSWFAAHGRPFGWVRTIKAEPWHFEYKPALDTHVPAPTVEDDVTPDDIAAIAAAVWRTPVQRGGKAVPAIQELADTKTGVLALLAQGDGVDEKALAAALAPMLTGPLVTALEAAHVPSAQDVADAVVAETASRLANG